MAICQQKIFTVDVFPHRLFQHAIYNGVKIVYTPMIYMMYIEEISPNFNCQLMISSLNLDFDTGGVIEHDLI